MSQNKNGTEANQKWVSMAALSSAILAVLAAVSSLSSNYHGSEITRELIRNTNQWSYFQAKGIKASILQTKMELLVSMKKAPSPQDQDKLKEYRLEQDQIVQKTKEQEASIQNHLKMGGIYSRSVILFQIAIGIVAVAILTRKNTFWLGGMGVAATGLYFVAQALLLG
jgi:hypothetical protein